MSYQKPLPVLDLWNKPFWEGCKEKRFRIQKCCESGEYWFPPSPISPVTRTEDWEWVEVSGRAKVRSWVVMHQIYFKAFADESPYLIAQVQLDEGPMLITNIVGINSEEIQADMPVEVVFEEVTSEITLPKFQKQM